MAIREVVLPVARNVVGRSAENLLPVVAGKQPVLVIDRLPRVVGGSHQWLLEEHRIGTTLMAPADLNLQSGQLVQPDIFEVSFVGGKEPLEWSDFPVPLLVVEVLSPSTARYDRITKRRRFQRSRVDEYWIVDADARRIERWRPDDQEAELLADRITWQPSAGGPDLTIDLDRYFATVWGET